MTSKAGKQSPFLHGIPVVSSLTERDALFPTPDTNQRVELPTGERQRYDGAQWITVGHGINGDDVYSAKAKGAKFDALTDDTSSIQAAITACANDGGRGFVRLERGSALVASSLSLAADGISLDGRGAGGRYSQAGGTQLLYSGTGACVQIGTSKIGGNPLFDASYSTPTYDGFQWCRVRHLSIKHSASDTALLNGQQSYKAGSIGIQDWRGGGGIYEDIWVENFDYPFWGLQSDFNSFNDFTYIYAHNGVYLGPRSDQNVFTNLQANLCDTALWLDNVSAARFVAPSFVGNGSATTPPIKIKTQYAGGSSNIVFTDAPWFERQQGFVGTVSSLIEIGKGGTVTEGPIMIYDPLITVTNSSTVTSYFAEIDHANEVFIHRAANAASGFNLLTKFILFSGSGSPKVHATSVPDQNLSYASTSSGTPALLSHEMSPQVQSQKNANITLTLDTMGVLPVTVAGGNVTVILPAASTVPNRTLFVKRTDASANTLTVTCAGADTYDDTTTSKTIAANSVLRLIPNFPATGWLVI